MIFFSTISFAVSAGRCAHVSSGPYGEASRNVAPSRAFESMSYFWRNEKLWQAMKSGDSQRYGLRIGLGPKRRCDTVRPPAFFESYTK